MRDVSLVMFKSDGTRRDFPLAKRRVVVGRKANCDLRIPLTSVSRQHCQITLEDEKIEVKDLGSSNGTYHNSIRIQEATLSAGDELVVGPVVFTLVVDGQPAQIKPVRTIVANDRGTHETSGSPLGAVAGVSGASGASQDSGGGGGSSVGSVSDSSDDLDLPAELEDGGASPTADPDDSDLTLEALSFSEDSDEFDDIDFLDDDDDV